MAANTPIDLKALKKEYDSLETGDPRRQEIHTLVSSETGKGVFFNFYDTDVQRLFGNEFIKGTPEYAKTGETLRGQTDIKRTTDEITTKITESKEGILETIKEGVKTAKDEITTAADSARTEYTEGEADIKAAGAAGKQELQTLGAATETKLADLGSKVGQDIRDTYTTAGEEAKGYLDPYAEKGKTALDKLGALLGLGGESPEEIQKALESTPGYQFNFAQGMKAGTRAAGGRALGGRAMMELQRIGAGIATQTYQSQVQNLSGLAGYGLTAATGMGDITMRTAGGVSQGYTFEGATTGRGIELGAGYSASGIEMGTRADIAGTEFGAGGRARTDIMEGSALSSMTMAGTGMTTGAEWQGTSAIVDTLMKGTMSQAQAAFTRGDQAADNAWSRIEIDVARELAEMEQDASAWGDLLGVAGKIAGGFFSPGGLAASFFGF